MSPAASVTSHPEKHLQVSPPAIQAGGLGAGALRAGADLCRAPRAVALRNLPARPAAGHAKDHSNSLRASPSGPQP